MIEAEGDMGTQKSCVIYKLFGLDNTLWFSVDTKEQDAHHV